MRETAAKVQCRWTGACGVSSQPASRFPQKLDLSEARGPISVHCPGKSSCGDPISKPSKWAICAATSSRFPEPAKHPKYCSSLAFASAESRRDLKAILRAVWQHVWSISFFLGLHRDCPKTRHSPIPAVPAAVAGPLPWLARHFEHRYDQRLWHGRRKSGCLLPIMCRCSMAAWSQHAHSLQQRGSLTTSQATACRSYSSSAAKCVCVCVCLWESASATQDAEGSTFVEPHRGAWWPRRLS